MNFLLTAYARTAQTFRSPRRKKKLPKRQLYPSLRVEEALRAFPSKKPLIICREGFAALAENYAHLLKLVGKDAVVWCRYSRRPTAEDAENARLVFAGQGCDGILVIGDGIVIDAAKYLALRIRKNHDAGKHGVPLLAVPTEMTVGQESIAGFAMNKKSKSAEESKKPEKGKPVKLTYDRRLLPVAVVYAPQLVANSRAELITARTVEALCRAMDLSLSRRVKTKDRVRITAVFRELISLIRSRAVADTPEVREKIHGLYQELVLFSNRYPEGYIIGVSRALSARRNLPLCDCQAAILPVLPKLYGKKLTKYLPSLCSIFDLPALDYDSPAAAEEGVMTVLAELTAQALAPNPTTAAKTLTLPLKSCRFRKESRKLAHRVNPRCVAPAVLGRRDLRKCLLLICDREAK